MKNFSEDSIETVMILVFAVIILVIMRALLVRSNLIHSKINLDDLLLGDDGKLSKAAAVMMTALLVTSWGMLNLFLTDKMTEGYFGLYLAAWVTPTVAVIITKAQVAKVTSGPGDGQ